VFDFEIVKNSLIGQVRPWFVVLSQSLDFCFVSLCPDASGFDFGWVRMRRHWKGGFLGTF
jgi:hypothetical protein